MPSFDPKVAIEQYKDILEFSQRAVGLPFYSESLLPLPKSVLKSALATLEPATDQTTALIQALDKFIPHDVALELLADFDQVERKRHQREYEPEAVKRYWKNVHALFGVDEQLDR